MSELDVDSVLERARDAWRHGERRATLSWLIELWQRSRHPRVATAVDRVARWMPEADVARGLVPPARVPPEDRSPWLNGLAELDEGILTSVLARLSRWPADPRVAESGMELLLSGRRLKKSTWRPLLALLTELRDGRRLEDLDRQLPDAWLDRRRMELRDWLSAVEVAPLPDGAGTWLDEVGRVVEDPEEEQALNQVLEDPDDDQRALVYADWLSMRGDPRGAFVLLQRMPERTEEQERQMLQLQEAHAAEWIGEGAEAFDLPRCHWEGGFLHTATMKRAPRRVLDLLRGAPIWRTVRRVFMAPRMSRVSSMYDLVLANPALKRLTAVHGLEPAGLRRVIRDGQPVQWTALTLWAPWVIQTPTQQGLREGRNLGRLRDLTLDWLSWQNALIELTADAPPLFDQLDRLTVLNYSILHDQARRWVDAFEPTGLPRLRLLAQEWVAELERSEGRFSTLRIRPGTRDRANALASFMEGFDPDRIERIIIEGTANSLLLDVVLERFSNATVEGLGPPSLG